MAPMAEKTISVFELCVRQAAVVEPNRRKAGLLAGKVATFVYEWAMMMRETGTEEPTLMDWREWACVSDRTAFYRLSDFRRLFGEWHQDPTVLARHMNRARAAGDSAVPARLVPA